MFRLKVDESLVIRQFQLADAEVAFRAIDRNRARLREWLPWVDATHSTDDVTAFIQRTHEQLERGLGPQAAIWLGRRFAGCIGCHPYDLANRSVSLGYWLDTDLSGRGIVTRCARAMVDYLFGTAMLHRVEIRCGVGNLRSCAVPERLGFVREGVARHSQWVDGRWLDLVVWSMLAGEWPQAKRQDSR